MSRRSEESFTTATTSGAEIWSAERCANPILTVFIEYEKLLKVLKSARHEADQRGPGSCRVRPVPVAAAPPEPRAGGVAVELGSRAFDVLMVLAEARGALVTKDEILSRVWPDTVVEENNLVVQIFALRKALGEDLDFIRTVSRGDYRFVAQSASAAEAAQLTPSSNLPMRVSGIIVREIGLETNWGYGPVPSISLDVSTAPRRWPRPLLWRVFGSGLVLVVVAAAFTWLSHSETSFPGIRSIAHCHLSLSRDVSQITPPTG